jgi:site-specific recombinase XerD
VLRRVTRTGAVSSPLTAQSVALIIKRRVRAAGLDPREFAGHSLRAGYATQAARDGHHPTQIAATTRHQDQRVLAGYIRAGSGKDDIAHVL